MRPVSGLERPVVQWSFVAAAVILMVVTGASAVALRRARTEVSHLKQAGLEAALDKRQLEVQLWREQVTRETLSREVSRMNGGSRGRLAPTVTLLPLTTRSASAPAPTVEAQPPDRLLEVRLKLPPRAPGAAIYTVTMRRWSSGDVVWVRGGLPADRTDVGPAVVVRVAGDALSPGAYEFTVATTPADGQRVEIASYEVGVAAAGR